MSIQDYFDQSCEDEVEKDYRVARGILGWQEGDEPAEDSIRRLRDGDDSEYQRLQRENAALKAELQMTRMYLENAQVIVALYNELKTAIENLRQIPSWATIQLGTDIPCCPYSVFIDEGDVGGERILAVTGVNLPMVLKRAYAEYLLFNREYANTLKGHDDD